jgi:hypothetical protein
MTALPTRVRITAAAALLACLGASPARAGSISISMTATAEMKDGALTVGLKIKNSGDEAAGSVVAVLRLQDREARGTRRDSLGPGETIEESLTLSATDLGPGRWPFRVATDYTDANQYPFEALHVAVATVGQPPLAKVAVPEIAIPSLSDSGTAAFKVKNLAGTARDASVTVFVPDGLETPDGVQKVALPAWETKDVRVQLVNRTALAGSRYPIFVAVEYDEDGVHQALVSSTTVEIQPHKALISRGLLYVVGALIVAWLIVLLRRRGA